MGYNNHISGKKELFFEIDESVDGEIKFGNNIILLVFVREKIPISLKNGSTNFISDVFYVHELHHNLLSMDQLSKKKIYDIRIRNGTYTIFNKKNIKMIASVLMTSNRLFSLKLSTSNFSCLITMIDDNNWF